MEVLATAGITVQLKPRSSLLFIGLSRSLTFRKICVNVVRAGFVITPQQTSGRTAKQIKERVEKIPFGRPGRPEEIAGLFSFLFGETSSFITGQRISISGGD